jgi:hypothetical protein
MVSTTPSVLEVEALSLRTAGVGIVEQNAQVAELHLMY